MGKQQTSIEQPQRSGWQLWQETFEQTFTHYLEHPYVLGPQGSMTQQRDPKHNLFTLARYKFCAKMLQGKKRLLEIGCGDGLGLEIVLYEVQPEMVTCLDFDDLVIQDNQRRLGQYKNVEFLTRDVTQEKLKGEYDGGWCIDVIEHIYPEVEEVFWNNVVCSLSDQGVFMVGTPNVTADSYASQASRASHVNLKDAQSLRESMAERFHNVFLFSMNDEVIHTGFAAMAHYLFVIGVGVVRDKIK